MYKISEETIKNAYKPYDVVTVNSGAVGFIQEVSLNNGQENPLHQISYAVNWLVGEEKHAWWIHSELNKHCNIFVKIAECSCDSMGSSAKDVKKLINL